MAGGTRRTFAQGSKGGWYVVGSERVVDGKKVKSYVSADVAMRAMEGKATDEEIDEAITSRPSGKKPRTKTDAPPDSDAGKNQPASSNLPAGRTPKERDPRLPAQGTTIKSKDGTVYVKEDAQGVFHLYDSGSDKQLATGKTLTALMVQHTGKPVNAFAMLGLQTSKKDPTKRAIDPDKLLEQQKKKRAKVAKQRAAEDKALKPRPEPKPKQRPPADKTDKHVKRRPIAPKTPASAKKRRTGKPTGKQTYAERLGQKHFHRSLRGSLRNTAESSIGIDKRGWVRLRLDLPDGRQFAVKTSPDHKQTWAKEKAPGAKPFKVTDAWAQEIQNVRASKQDSGRGKREISTKTTVQKALTLAEHDCGVGACEVYLDGMILRDWAGGVSSFLSFGDVDATADDISKAVSDTPITKSIQVYLERADHDAIDGLVAVVRGFDQETVQKAVEDKLEPRKGYPKKPTTYADRKNYKYPVDTEAHVKAVLSYFGNADNRKKYTESEQRDIARRIVAAAKRFGIDVDADTDVGRLALVKA